MKNEILSAVWSTIAGAALVGGGTMVLTAHNDNSVQDTKIEQHERQLNQLDETLKRFDSTVQQLDKNVAVLTSKVERL